MLLLLFFTVVPAFIDYAMAKNCPHIWVPVVTFILCGILTTYIELHQEPEPSVFDKMVAEGEKEMKEQREKNAANKPIINNTQFTIEEDD